MLYVHIVWFHHLFILMEGIHLADVLLKSIHARDVKNVDIEQMLRYIAQLHIQSVLIN